MFWIVDNGSSHRGAASVKRLEGRVAEPARWCTCRSQRPGWTRSEIYFSILQRKVLTPNDFTDLGGGERRLLAFERRYESVARPFEWKFTRADLAKVMKRLAAKDDLAAAA